MSANASIRAVASSCVESTRVFLRDVGAGLLEVSHNSLALLGLLQALPHQPLPAAPPERLVRLLLRTGGAVEVLDRPHVVEAVRARGGGRRADGRKRRQPAVRIRSALPASQSCHSPAW